MYKYDYILYDFYPNHISLKPHPKLHKDRSAQLFMAAGAIPSTRRGLQGHLAQGATTNGTWMTWMLAVWIVVGYLGGSSELPEV